MFLHWNNEKRKKMIIFIILTKEWVADTEILTAENIIVAFLTT